MGMADDDLAYVVANTHTLSDQQSKFYYASGFSAGTEVSNAVMSSTLGNLKYQTDFVFQLLTHEADLGEDYLTGKPFFTRAVRNLNDAYDHLATYITFGGTNDNNFSFEVVEAWAWGKQHLVKKLVEYPALYREVLGCSKNVPSSTLEWVRLKEFRKHETLNEQQTWLAELMKEHKALNDLGTSYVDKFACPCSSCNSCCGNGCKCSYTHLDNDEYELGCDDPDECDWYEHSVCHACQSNCECC